MTDAEFDSKLLTIKIPFRVSEAARYILVRGLSKKTAIYVCKIELADDLAKLDIALKELSAK